MTVSVVLLCYNHEQYVRQAVASVLSQKFSRKWELVIADDCSADRTRDEIECELSLQTSSGPAIVRCYRSENIGMHRNLISAMMQCRGEYIALLEGDDYWCDDRKLEMQSRMMDLNKDLYICAHGTDVQRGGVVGPYLWRINTFRSTYSVEDYVHRLFFHTSSMMIRSGFSIPGWAYRAKQLDQALVIGCSRPQLNKICMIRDKMSVYRIHANGITQSLAHRNKRAAIWSHLRIICGALRDCDWIDRGVLERKARELIFQLRFVQAALVERCALGAVNPRAFFRVFTTKAIAWLARA